MSKLNVQQAFDLLISIGKKNGEKGCIKKEELLELLKTSAAKKFPLRAYDGFEPSGRMHIAQGLMKTINVNKLTRSGVHFTFLVADWFAQMNNKFDGDLTKIQAVGKYFIEVWRACGMDLTNVEFVWSSEEINKRPNEYWPLVMDIARKNNVSRIKRCGQIMGRSSTKIMPKVDLKKLLQKIHSNRKTDEGLDEEQFFAKYDKEFATELDENALNKIFREDPQPVAQLMYPLMQCADIFFLKANICQLGLDQLKVNVLAREYCDLVSKEKHRKKLRKPVVISHPMLMGLKEGQAKMSKSDPDSAIFMEDTAVEVARKIKKAYCRPGDIETNPILDYLENIVFPWYDELDFQVERSDENGGNKSYKSYQDVSDDFARLELHPSDLKRALAREINKLLDPVRAHFNTGTPKELLRRVKSFKPKPKNPPEKK